MLKEIGVMLKIMLKYDVDDFTSRTLPEDWVIGTGKSTTVRDFVSMAFRYVGVELEFIGEGK